MIAIPSSQLWGIALYLLLALSFTACRSEEALWLERQLDGEEMGELPEWSGNGGLRRLNPRHPKRFEYDYPSEGSCTDTTSKAVNDCFTYYQDSTDQKWYMENCCACEVEAKFNIYNPANSPDDQPPGWIFFDQGSLPIGSRQRLFFLDDNPGLQPTLYLAELNC